MRRRLSHRGFYGRLPDRYPIFRTVIPGETEQLCAERPTNVNTLGGREALCASYSLIIPGFEPRALSRAHRTHCTHRTPVLSYQGVYTGCTQGGTVGRHIPGMYPPWYSREAYTGVCTTLGTPWV